MKDLKVLVTGGAGFIGSHLVDTLLNLGNKVIVYDNFDKCYSGKKENIQHNIKNPRFTLVKADILDLKTLVKYTKSVDMVFHLAALPGVRFSADNPINTTTVNILGTLNVLRAAKKARIKKLLFASSSSVYGQPNYMPTDENHLTNPISIYGASKLCAEKYCKIFHEQMKIPLIILRFYTVFGPRQRPDMAIHKWTRAIFKNEPIRIYGDGNQTRDFTYIDDVIDGTIRAAETDGIDGETFNLGGGSRININKVINMLIKLSSIDARIIHESPKLGDVQDTHADINKARRVLGFKPKIQIMNGLKKFIRWYKVKKLRE